MAIPRPTEDSVALVTGASSGIGRELAHQLAAAGHDCVLVARRVERLEALAAELRERYRIRCELVPCDVSDPDARAALEDRISELGLSVEVLVLSAGFGMGGPFLSQEPERLALMVHTNIDGVIALTRTYAPAMVGRGRGAILIVSSVAGNQPMPNIAAYSATKAAVTCFGEALHEELRPLGVTVTTLAPGGVATEFAQVAGADPDSNQQSPSALMATAEETAKAGLDAMAQGRRITVPGVAVKAVALAGRYLPRPLWLRISRQLLTPKKRETPRRSE